MSLRPSEPSRGPLGALAYPAPSTALWGEMRGLSLDSWVRHQPVGGPTTSKYTSPGVGAKAMPDLAR